MTIDKSRVVVLVSTTLVSLLGLCARTSAQENPAPSRLSPAAQSTLIELSNWHRLDAKGTWRTTRSSYGAIFDDEGVAFRPAGPRHQGVEPTVRWQTRDVTIGKSSLTGIPRPWRIDGDRIARHLGSVVEAYDILGTGAEQTFTITHRPATQGDLVVTGRVISELTAESRAARHDKVVFRSPSGEPIVSYGAALAVDADGNTHAMTTAVEGDQIELRLDGNWLASAAFPVVVDPLLSTAFIVQSSTDRAVIDHDPTHDELMIVFRDPNGVTAVLCDDDYSNVTIVFTDSTAGSDGGAPQVVRSDKGWCIVYESPASFPFPGETLVHYRALGDRTPSTAKITVATTGGEVDVAATSVGDFLIANTTVLTINARIIDGTTGSVIMGPTTVAGPTALIPFGGLALSRYADSGNGVDRWVLTYALDPFFRPSEVYMTTVTSTAGGLQSGIPVLLSSDEAGVPKIDGGAGGEYMVTWTTTNPSKVFMRRFQWPLGSTVPTTIRTSNLGLILTTGEFTNGDICFDHVGKNHWTLVYRTPNVIQAAVLGYDGRVTELPRPTSVNTGLAPGIAFDSDVSQWISVWPNDSVSHPIYCRRVAYFPTGNVVFGTACGNGQMSTYGGAPRAGNFDYGFRLTSARPNTAALLWISGASAFLPLNSLGAQGCFLHVDPQLIASVSTVTDANGLAEQPLGIPSGAIVDWVAQWAYLNPGANKLGLQTSQGVQFSIH